MGAPPQLYKNSQKVWRPHLLNFSRNLDLYFSLFCPPGCACTVNPHCTVLHGPLRGVRAALYLCTVVRGTVRIWSGAVLFICAKRKKIKHHLRLLLGALFLEAPGMAQYTGTTPRFLCAAMYSPTQGSRSVLSGFFRHTTLQFHSFLALNILSPSTSL